ncbi:MAG: right-handed parallel beta-helix repeat-containing protein [Armatimonadetes bacterium]|nr:right-handed parallel beta-helix repeat-containing protein [Armatimonadota bacterium]
MFRLLAMLLVAAGLSASLGVAQAPGDVDRNGDIDLSDLCLFIEAWAVAHTGGQWPASADLAEPFGVLSWADADAMLSAFLSSTSVPKPTRYVSADGSDEWPGTLSRPWRTIQHACDECGPGDVVRVLPGVYHEDIELWRGGEEGRPLVLYGAGATVQGSITFEQGCSHVVLEGFEIHQSGTAWCISLLGTNRHITLRRITTVGGDSGLHLTAGEHGHPLYGAVEDIVVDECTFTGANWTGVDATPGPVKGITIRRCQVRDNGNAEAGFGADGIAVEMGDHIIVEDCVVANNSSDGIDLCSRDSTPREEVIVRRCRVIGNHGDGVKLWCGGTIENCLITGHGLTPVVFVRDALYRIVNCTVARNFRDVKSYALTAAYPDQDNPTGEARVYMYNCIFAFNGPPTEPTGLYFGPRVVLVEDYNCFFSRADEELCVDRTGGAVSVSREDIVSGRWAALGGGQHSLSADPKFLAADDFRLAADSPCRGRGLADAAPPTDIDLRPRVGSVDLGCYQAP